MATRISHHRRLMFLLAATLLPLVSRIHPAGFQFNVQQPADSAARLQIVSSFSTFARDGKKAIEGRLLILQEGQTIGESDFDQTLLFVPLSQ